MRREIISDLKMEIRDLRICYEELRDAVLKHVENLEMKEGNHMAPVREMFERLIKKYDRIN